MLGELARECAHRFGDTPVYVSVDGWSISYRDLDRLSDQVAAGLRRRGIGAGDVVALALPALPEYPVAYLAAAKIGAITAGVNHRLAGRERAAALSVANPKLTLATPELAPDDRTVEAITPAEHPDDLLHNLREPGGDASTIPDDATRPIAIVFTSGTTGTPKGVLFCNHQLAAITAIDASIAGGRDRWGGGGKGLISTSTAHLGFMTKFPGNLRRGGTSYFMGTWRAEEALRLTAEHGMTGIAGVPTQVALMLRVAGFDHYDLSSVQAIVVGGGPASPALVREARERFHAPLMMRYSCTEAGIGIGTGLADPAEDAEISVGRPHPGVDLALLDEDDQPVPAGEVGPDHIGQVCLRSPAVMEGYWEDPDATRAAFTKDGYVRTGDLGWLDDQGRLRLAGRTKEMYVRGGYNVYPFEVENVLASHPQVAAVAIVARPDAVMGEKGVAVIVPRDPLDPPELADLRSFGSSQLARYKLPEALRLVDELPLTSMEKVDRKALFALVTQD